jgi:hypothetical protein
MNSSTDIADMNAGSHRRLIERASVRLTLSTKLRQTSTTNCVEARLGTVN